MTDALPIIAATKLGYEIFSDEDNLAWYTKEGKLVGPYKTLEEAAYDALADYDMNQAYAFWKDEDDDEDA